jgi:cytoskeletal protein RodZ
MATVTSARPGDGCTPHTEPREDRGTSLGELLRLARERRGLTLEGIASETKIPQRHLEALEYDNLTAIPAGFYRRAEIRAYARAVGLDQSLALARLESALTPVEARAASREIPRTRESIRPRTYLLIVLGVVTVAAAVFGRAISERTPALEPGADIRSATDSLPKPVLPIRDASLDTVMSQGGQSEPVARLSALPENTMTVSRGAVVVSDAGLRVTTETTEARVSTDSVTELVVTTQPAGARVTVNGIGWGSSPITVRHLPPGDKRIRMSKEGYATEERVLRLAEGQRRTLDIRLESAP